MNNPLTLTLLLWRTRNQKRSRQAKELCKDYGLHSLADDCYLGGLKKKERGKIEQWFNGIFINKTESYYIVSICKGCHESSPFYGSKKEVIERSLFEII